MNAGPLVRTALALGVVLGLAACADGYPSDNTSLALHFGMDGAEIETAMNHIGSQRYLKQRWAYALTDRCSLQAGEVPGLMGSATEPVVLDLRHVAVSMEKTVGPRGHRVWVTPAPDSSEAVPLIEGAHWSDASQIKWLVEFARSRCLRPQRAS
ncbi:hypothetical protein [Hydrogenophaga electricum]|uniref:Lipoprotein n=1 Tax=Hydrogenophaga electricum TaxID=1230953 RepID=A0ABQ6C307_9BURK|nr:hypothetical protein [Hydrogenophaga electricum]GLS14728.1 hypothetical protein GCM10007935_21600 [Hydrogenophaga electricum]